MQLNEATEVLVDRLTIQNNIMTLGALVKNNSGVPKELGTKFSVIFKNKSETRILPLPITDINIDENGDCIGYAIFKYELDVLFKNRDLNEFAVVVQAYNKGSYVDIIVEDMGFNQIKKGSEYACLLENGTIIIRRKRPVKQNQPNWFISFFCSVYRIAEFLLGTLMLPLFFLDGIYVIVLGAPRRSEEGSFEGTQLVRLLRFVRGRYSAFCRMDISLAAMKTMILNLTASLLTVFCRKDGILFVSSRRNDLSGNIAYVNEILQRENVKVRYWLEAANMRQLSLKSILSLSCKIAKSSVLAIDDYTPILNDIWALKRCKLIQLWHACGAFKTFGFSRIGKDGGGLQTAVNHRNYDYAIVSSSEVRRFYAEGFGIDIERVKALGIPRTDVFFKEEYQITVQEKFYEKYPVLRDKKIILFAPTFRGNGAESAYYPFERFHVETLLEELSEEYVIIIKHHPFVSGQHPVPEKIQGRVLDLSKESEINELLFITDVLITDYSSVIFEAALLNVPMLFYAFDLEEYTAHRDFYYPFRDFVPGTIVRNMDQIKECVKQNNYSLEKVEIFKHRFFDNPDGKASERVAAFMLDLLQG